MDHEQDWARSHPSKTKRSRPKMVGAELSGAHTHRTAGGKRVHIWRRGDTYMVRGRLQGRQFGESLGSDETEAAFQLRRILSELDHGSYVPPKARDNQALAPPNYQRRFLHDITNAFLIEKRKLLGKRTSQDYKARLMPLLEFADLPSTRKRWPTASTIDRDFAIQYRQYLAPRRVTRNGRAASSATLISPRQIYNNLDAIRSLINWAKDPRIGLLRPSFLNPFDDTIVGTRPAKDPLRPSVFPLDRRIELVSHMDEWQLTHLALSLVLPLRPEDFAAILIRDLDFKHRQISFGTRFSGRDFNKGRVTFVVPFPDEITSLLRFCCAGREDGPLLRGRAVVMGHRSPKREVKNGADLDCQLANNFRDAAPENVATENDQKRLVRSAIRDMGGVSQDELRKEFLSVLRMLRPHDKARFYDLRGSINTEMNLAGVSIFVQRYITGHTVRDILSEYVSLDPIQEMQKYFESIKPLLEAFTSRAEELRLQLETSPPVPVGDLLPNRVLMDMLWRRMHGLA